MLAFGKTNLSSPNAGAGAGAITPDFLLQSQGSPIQKIPDSPVPNFRTPVTASVCKPPTPTASRSGFHQRLCLETLLILAEARLSALPKAFSSGRSGGTAPGGQAASLGELEGLQIQLPWRGWTYQQQGTLGLYLIRVFLPACRDWVSEIEELNI